VSCCKKEHPWSLSRILGTASYQNGDDYGNCWCVKYDRIQGVITSVSQYTVVLVQPATVSNDDSPDLSANSNNDEDDGLPSLVTVEALSNKNPHITACYYTAWQLLLVLLCHQIMSKWCQMKEVLTVLPTCQWVPVMITVIFLFSKTRSPFYYNSSSAVICEVNLPWHFRFSQQYWFKYGFYYNGSYAPLHSDTKKYINLELFCRNQHMKLSPCSDAWLKHRFSSMEVISLTDKVGNNSLIASPTVSKPKQVHMLASIYLCVNHRGSSNVCRFFQNVCNELPDCTASITGNIFKVTSTRNLYLA